MHWWLDFHTVLKREQHWRRFFSTFGKIAIPGDIWLDTNLVIVSHASYNHPINKIQLPWKVAYLNTLSSLNGAIKNRLQDILWWHECSMYEESLLLVKQGHIEAPESAWTKTIEKIVAELLPEEIHFLNIPVSTKAQEKLERYYLGVGEVLRGNGRILRADYYESGVSYRIRD